MSNYAYIDKERIKEFFKEDPAAAYYKGGKKYWQSVHGNAYTRYNKAKEEARKIPVDKEKIIGYVNDLLKAVGIAEVINPIMKLSEINYKSLKEEYELDDERDLVWIKFTKDGFVGCVAASNDINFQFPTNYLEYDVKEMKYKKDKGKFEEDWKYNTSGILVHKLNKAWDKSFVLVFPLKKLKESDYNRHNIEMAIGNYLSKEKNVPIIDYYSHNMKKEDQKAKRFV